MPKSTNPPSTWNQINGELFGEMVFHDIADEYRDTYVIGFIRQWNRNEFRLTSYYLNEKEQFSKPVHHYPQKLSDLQTGALKDPRISSFYNQLDQILVSQLITVGMDSLAAYALLHNHPALRPLLKKPLLLMAAYIRLYRFEKLNVEHHEAYERWFPKLFFKERLSKGVYRVLSRLDISDPTEAVSAAEYIIRNYEHIKPILRGRGTLSPGALRESIIKLVRFPELIHARWFQVECFRDKEACEQATQLYSHTKELLHAAGNADWRQTLLKQMRTVDQLLRLHDRYIPRSLIQSGIPPETALPDFDIEDDDYFTILRTAGSLLEIADKFQNCAAIFAAPSARGLLLHAFYQRDDETGLLQINTEDLNAPSIAEFKGPTNRAVSKQAWEDAWSWLSKCAPIDGQLSYKALMYSAATDTSSDYVRESTSNYSTSTRFRRLNIYTINTLHTKPAAYIRGAL